MKIERVDLMVLKIPIVGHFETSYGRIYEENKLILKLLPRHFNGPMKRRRRIKECLAIMLNFIV